jgi:hypothetical protein
MQRNRLKLGNWTLISHIAQATVLPSFPLSSGNVQERR